MLVRVRELIIQKPWKNVELEESGMRDLETFKDNSFTHANTNFGIALWVRMQRGL
jgi:ubiquinone/menaquinone biosynthesis C-methylase UbiE